MDKQKLDNLYEKLKTVDNIGTMLKELIQHENEYHKTGDIQKFKSGIDKLLNNSSPRLQQIGNLAWDSFIETNSKYTFTLSDDLKIGKTLKDDFVIYYKPIKEIYIISNYKLLKCMKELDVKIEKNRKKENGYNDKFMHSIHEKIFLTMFGEIENVIVPDKV